MHSITNKHNNNNTTAKPTGKRRYINLFYTRGWSGGAMVLGKLPVPGRPTIWIRVGQGPIVLAVGAGGGLFGHFTLLYVFSSLSPSLWETARYRLKYCLKGPLNPKQPTNQIFYTKCCKTMTLFSWCVSVRKFP